MLQVGTCHQKSVFGGPLQGVAECTDATRNDGNLVYRIGAGQRQRHQRMPHLVIGHGFPLLRIEHTVLPFQAGHDALDGGGEVLQFHSLRLAPRRVQRCFVYEIGQISAGKAGG